MDDPLNIKSPQLPHPRLILLNFFTSRCLRHDLDISKRATWCHKARPHHESCVEAVVTSIGSMVEGRCKYKRDPKNAQHRLACSLSQFCFVTSRNDPLSVAGLNHHQPVLSINYPLPLVGAIHVAPLHEYLKHISIHR